MLHFWETVIRPRLERIDWKRPLCTTLKEIWVALGEPFPDQVRHIRHTVLGRVLATNDAPPPAIRPTTPTPDSVGQTVAIVIPCHNYGHFLAEAIESALQQTVKAHEIIVVDDASTDDSANIAAQFASRGVRYVRGEWLSVGAARNTGAHATTSDFLIFLDADDLLHPSYIGACLRAFAAHADAGIAYCNQQYFGESKMYYEAPSVFDWKRFDEQNHLNPSAMVRREALLQAGGFSHGVNQDGDWITWRRILRLGWKAVKADCVFYYRIHGKNMTGTMRSANTPYAVRAGFLEEPATLCLALSGDEQAWPETARFLEEQTFPHDVLRLVLLDTSRNEHFHEMVKEWLKRSDYASHTLMQESIGPKGATELSQREAGDDAMIYNRLARATDTTLVMFLQEGVVPPIDAFTRLAAQFTQNAVSVSAMGGNSFACVIVRGEYIRRTTFHAGPPYHRYDQNFYHQAVVQDGRMALLDSTLRS